MGTKSSRVASLQLSAVYMPMQDSQRAVEFELVMAGGVLRTCKLCTNMPKLVHILLVALSFMRAPSIHVLAAPHHMPDIEKV